MKKRFYRSVWISDLHLGTKGCQAEGILAFLNSIDCKYLYLVGDIIDGWAITRQSTYFPPEHLQIIRTILRMANNGVRVLYGVGNHDDFLRTAFRELHNDVITFGNVTIANEFVHEGLDGKRYLVTHGDLFDNVVRNYKWVSLCGAWLYDFLLFTNIYIYKVRRVFGLPYWSFSAFAKRNVKKAIEFIAGFEHALAQACKRKDLDGVICGHIHTAEIKEIEGVQYMNCGDWVEGCTSLMEHSDGTFELLTYHCCLGTEINESETTDNHRHLEK